MKYETHTVRVGERLGPVDRTFDFDASQGSYTDDWHKSRVLLFLEMVAGIEAGEEWEATTDGGWPRVGWGRVRDVGMWDGWPYWKPMPSFYLDSFLGGSWHSFHSLTDARPVSAQPPPEPPPSSSRGVPQEPK